MPSRLILKSSSFYSTMLLGYLKALGFYWLLTLADIYLLISSMLWVCMRNERTLPYFGLSYSLELSLWLLRKSLKLECINIIYLNLCNMNCWITKNNDKANLINNTCNSNESIYSTSIQPHCTILTTLYFQMAKTSWSSKLIIFQSQEEDVIYS